MIRTTRHASFPTRALQRARAGLLTLAAVAAATCDAQQHQLPSSPLERGAAQDGIWVSRTSLLSLPTKGDAWDAVRLAADSRLFAPRLWHPDDQSDVLVLAQALVYVRTGNEHYRDEVIQACLDIIGTEGEGVEVWQGDVLSLARNLPAYVVSADLVGLPPDEDRMFRDWLTILPDRLLRGNTLRGVHELRPNNWGTNAGAARAVIARYLGDAGELERIARVFRGWLGEREHYAGFIWNRSLAWQAKPDEPVGINPPGATRQGHSIDGVLPDEQRRGGGFTWPPPYENYVWEGLQGAMVQALVLERAGYDVFAWGHRALERAFLWLDQVAGHAAQGDDEWLAHLANARFGLDLPAPVPAQPGKNLGWTDWTHTLDPGGPQTRPR